MRKIDISFQHGDQKLFAVWLRKRRSQSLLLSFTVPKLIIQFVYTLEIKRCVSIWNRCALNDNSFHEVNTALNRRSFRVVHGIVSVNRCKHPPNVFKRSERNATVSSQKDIDWGLQDSWKSFLNMRSFDTSRQRSEEPFSSFLEHIVHLSILWSTQLCKES